QRPTPKRKEFSPLGHGSNLPREDPLELIQESFPAEQLIRLVVMKVRLAEVIQILRVVLVEFDDFLEQGFFAREIKVVEKTFWIKLGVNVRIAPVYRQARRLHRLEDLLARVAGQRLVFKGDVEFARLEKFNLARRPAADGVAEIVQDRPAGIHLLILGQLAKELDPLARFF